MHLVKIKYIEGQNTFFRRGIVYSLPLIKTLDFFLGLKNIKIVPNVIDVEFTSKVSKVPKFLL